jgi:ParB family chromosome partitioning protein
MTTNGISNIPLADIVRNPDQPRKRFNGASLLELAESIKENNGVLEPIVLEPTEDGLHYVIVAGERRWRASQLAGLPTILSIVRERTNHNGQERLLHAMIENIQREDMNVIDVAEGFQALIENGMEVHEISKKIGKSVTHIYNALSHLKLEPAVREMMREGKLSPDMRAVKAYLSLTAEMQIGLAERAVVKHMTIPAVVEAAKRLNKALNDGSLKKDRAAKSPAMNVARKKYGPDFDDETPPANWNALRQLGKALPWPVVVKAADAMCAICELRSMASESTCHNCPGVDLLGNLVSQAEAVKS